MPFKISGGGSFGLPMLGRSGGSSGPVARSYLDEVLLDNPQRLYLLDETEGATAADEGSDGEVGTYQNNYTLGQDALVNDGGTSVTFLGNGAGVTASALAGNSTGFSFEAWFNLDVHPSDDGAIQHLGRDDSQFLFFMNPNGAVYLGFRVNDSGGGIGVMVQYPLANLSVGVTYHIVGTWDLATERMFINGEEVASEPFAGTGALGAGSGLHVARRPNGTQALQGRLDNVTVYDHALTAERIKAHYDSGV